MSETILDFSKHLLITLIATFTFTANVGLDSTFFISKLLLVLAIFFTIISAFYCYLSFEVVIDSKSKQDGKQHTKNQASMTDVDKRKLKKRIKFQFWTCAIGLVCIGCMVAFEIFGIPQVKTSSNPEKELPIIVTEQFSDETYTLMFKVLADMRVREDFKFI